MTWAEVKKTLTTPPPPKPAPKLPPFGPQHIFGAGVLALGLYGLTKFVIARGRAQAEETRRLAEQRIPRRPEDEAQLAQAQNQRGEYGAQ